MTQNEYEKEVKKTFIKYTNLPDDEVNEYFMTETVQSLLKVNYEGYVKAGNGPKRGYSVDATANCLDMMY